MKLNDEQHKQAVELGWTRVKGGYEKPIPGMKLWEEVRFREDYAMYQEIEFWKSLEGWNPRASVEVNRKRKMEIMEKRNYVR